MTNITVHVEPAGDTLTFWAEAPGFTAAANHLTPVVESVLEVYPDAVFRLEAPSFWWRLAGGRWEPMSR
jgi:hypothetical protein